MSDVPRWAFNAHVDQRDKEIERLNHDYTELQLAYNNLPKLLQEKFEVEIARLKGEFQVDKYPVATCPNCDGSGVLNSSSACCRIPGHAKECGCLVCQWMRSSYGKDHQVERLKGELTSEQAITSHQSRRLEEMESELPDLVKRLEAAEVRVKELQQEITDIRGEYWKMDACASALQEQLTALIQAGEPFIDKQEIAKTSWTSSGYGPFWIHKGKLDALAAAIESARGKA